MCVWANTATTWNLEEVCGFVKFYEDWNDACVVEDMLTKNTKRIDLNSSSIYLYSQFIQTHCILIILLHDRHHQHSINSTLGHTTQLTDTILYGVCLTWVFELLMWFCVFLFFYCFALKVARLQFYSFSIFFLKNDGNTDGLVHFISKTIQIYQENGCFENKIVYINNWYTNYTIV